MQKLPFRCVHSSGIFPLVLVQRGFSPDRGTSQTASASLGSIEASQQWRRSQSVCQLSGRTAGAHGLLSSVKMENKQRLLLQNKETNQTRVSTRTLFQRKFRIILPITGAQHTSMEKLLRRCMLPLGPNSPAHRTLPGNAFLCVIEVVHN